MRTKEVIQESASLIRLSDIAPAQESLASEPRVQTSGNKYRSQLQALRALDRSEPGRAATSNETFRQGRHHPYNVKQLPEEYAAPWGWRRGKAVRAKAPAGVFLPPPPSPHPSHPRHIPSPAPATAPTTAAAPLPLPSFYLPQPGPVAPEPIARAPAAVSAPAPAPAQPTSPPMRPEPAWLQQLKIDAQIRQASDVFSGRWAEMQLRLKLKNTLKKAEEVKRAMPEPQSAPEQQPVAQLKPTVERDPAAELQSATEPQPEPLPPIVDRPTPKPLPKRLTDEELTRYLGLVEQNDEWVELDLPVQPQREKWEAKARKQDPDYIRSITGQLAERFEGERLEKYEGPARKIAAPKKKKQAQ